MAVQRRSPRQGQRRAWPTRPTRTLLSKRGAGSGDITLVGGTEGRLDRSH